MRPLVVYYSYSGITRRLAEDIALITDGELRELKLQKPYSFSYNTAVKEVREEIEKGYCPHLTEGAEAIENAEVIFIGSPNWLKTFGRMIEDYKKECGNSTIKDGIALKGDYSFDQLKLWLDSNL